VTQRNHRKLQDEDYSGRAKESTEKTEACIPSLSKEQPDMKAREARSQPG
jgi:hypothetical protein